MNEEIKKILDTIKDIVEKNDDSIESLLIDITKWKLLLDYITNLQEENEMYAQIKDTNEEIIIDKYKTLKELQEEIHKLVHTSIVQKKQINNLKKENEKLKIANDYLIGKKLIEKDKMAKEVEIKAIEQKDYKSRCEKAIEYIEKHILDNKIEKVNWEYDDCLWSDMPAERIKPLIDILQNGSDSND